MEDLVSVVQDNITVEKLKLNVRFHHGTFEKFDRLILSRLIISSVFFLSYLILLSSGMNLFLLPSKTFIIFVILITLAVKLSVWMMTWIHQDTLFCMY